MFIFMFVNDFREKLRLSEYGAFLKYPELTQLFNLRAHKGGHILAVTCLDVAQDA